MNIVTKIFKAFRSISLNNPNGSRKELMTSFREKVLADSDMIGTLIDAEYERLARQWQPVETSPGNIVLAATASKTRQVVNTIEKRERAVEQRNAKARVAAAIRPFIWFEMQMPNGKKLRHCTGAELKRFGGIFLEISRHLKPSQVVDRHLEEKDIRNIAARLGGTKGRSTSGVELHA